MSLLMSNSSSLVPPSDWQLLILAGGRGERMGGVDKGLLAFQGRPLVCHLRDRFAPPRLRISANRHDEDYARLGLGTVPDHRDSFCGPLAGLESLLAATMAADDGAATVPAVLIPCDMPWLPADLPARLLAALSGEDTIAVAHDGERLQPLCMALHPARWRDDLGRYLDQGRRSVFGWLDDKPLQVCTWDDPAAFRNLNTPEDWDSA